MKKLFLCSALFLTLSLGCLFCACGEQEKADGPNDHDSTQQPNNPSGGSEQETVGKTGPLQVTISNSASWTPKGNVQLWSLNGELVEQREIVNNKATFKADKGRYIIQLDSAPETVAYSLPVTDGNGDITIKLEEAEEDERYGYVYGCTAVVLKGSVYQSNCLVGNCIMPEDGSLGECFNPREVENNGAFLYAFTGKFHFSVYDEELKVIKEFEDYVSVNKRFVILNLDGDAAGHLHTYLDWKTTKNATCTESGLRTGTCACGDTKTEEIPALGHTSGSYTVLKEPTCEETGVGAASVCERCKQATDEVVIPALGHDWVEGGSYKQPTCTEPGYSASAECSRCHEVRADEVIPALGHDFTGSTFVKIEATCQQAGLATVYCAHRGCNASESQTIPKREHEFTRVKTIQAPTCTEGGVIKMVCRYFCDQEKEPENVPPLGHDWEEVSIQREETCTEKGLRTHHCKRCNITEQYEPDPREHVYGDYVVDKAATALKEGSMSRHCIYCGEKGLDVVSIPVIQEKVEYSITVRRTNGKFYSKVQELKFEIYQGDSIIETIDATGNTTKIKISKNADSLVVTGLREGYSSKQEKYELKPGEPVVRVEIKAEIITKNHTKVNGKDQEIPPEKYIEVGDVMYDFLVRDSRGGTKWLSECIKGKELILLDFWWTGCTICHYETSQFQRVYNDFLQPYKDKILVIMINVMNDEDSKRIEDYRQQKGYPDDFVMAMGNSEDGTVSVKKYFYDIRTPGNVWIDGEGVMISRKRYEEYDRFKQFTLDFFDHLKVDELEESAKAVTVDNRKIVEDTFRDADSKSNERYFKKLENE